MALPEVTTEKDYERSPYEYLHKEMPDAQITKQFAMGKVTVHVR